MAQSTVNYRDREDCFLNGAFRESRGAMNLIWRGGSVLGGPFQGAGGLLIVGIGKKGQRRECRRVLGWELSGRFICDSRLCSLRPRDSVLGRGVSV